MTNYADSHNKGLFALASFYLSFGSRFNLSLWRASDTGVTLEVALNWC